MRFGVKEEYFIPILQMEDESNSVFCDVLSPTETNVH